MCTKIVLKNWIAFLIALAAGVAGYYVFTKPYVPAPEANFSKPGCSATGTRIHAQRTW